MDDPEVLEALIAEHSAEEQEVCKEVPLDAKVILQLCDLAVVGDYEDNSWAINKAAQSVKVLVLLTQLRVIEGHFGPRPLSVRLHKATTQLAALHSDLTSKRVAALDAEGELGRLVDEIRRERPPLS